MASLSQESVEDHSPVNDQQDELLGADSDEGHSPDLAVESDDEIIEEDDDDLEEEEYEDDNGPVTGGERNGSLAAHRDHAIHTAVEPVQTDSDIVEEHKKARSRKSGEKGSSKRKRSSSDAAGQDKKKPRLPPLAVDRHTEPGDRTCLWEGCNILLPSLETLVDHINNIHVGPQKSQTICSWEGCPRKGETQSSKFALQQHVRTHTGEKPYRCHWPECTQRFSRPDNMIKHYKSHETPQGEQKQKPSRQKSGKGTPRRSKAADKRNGHLQESISESAAPHSGGMAPPVELPILISNPIPPPHGASHQRANAMSPHHNLPPVLNGTTPSTPNNNHAYLDYRKHLSPPPNHPLYSEYQIQLDKYRYILNENELLEEEWRQAKLKLQRLKKEKDVLLDEMLKRHKRKSGVTA